MKSLSRRSKRILVATIALALAAGVLALSPGLQARPREPIQPPDTCSNCPAGPYIGPNGGVCQPVGCVRPGGACIVSGDCY